MNLRERVQERFSDLPKTQKSLIQRILANYEDFVFASVDEAANRLSVHKSTLVRLAQSLQYEGYADLRTDLQALYRTEIAPGRKLGKTLAEINDDTLFQQVVETEIMYLREAQKTVDVAGIHAAADLIIAARRIFVCGRGPQGPLAQLFAFRLRRFHMDVLTIEEEGRAILEKLQLLTKDDLLILFSFIDVSQEQRHAITLARKVGCRAVLITDSVAKEILEHVLVTIDARRGPATIYHTDIVPTAIMTAILLAVAKRQAKTVLPGMNHLQELRREFGYEFTVSERSEGLEDFAESS
ncbi:MurR/RpiR family transcriptional regulator [Candidatus Bipolaricaulota bacterium]|nr:MurR/RpiR family transcriptional regulator [Candidatus Bipolaricaulota bacterium]